MDPELQQALNELVTAHRAGLDLLSERIDHVEKAQGRPGGVGTPHALPGLPRPAPIDRELNAALRSFIRDDDDSGLRQNALKVGDDTGAGYLVIPQFADAINGRLYDQSPVRRLARVVTMGDGDAWVEPNDTGDVGCDWIGETSPRPETTAAAVGLLTIPLREIYALQVVTQRLLDDSRFDIAAWLAEKIGDKFGRKDGVSFVTGATQLEPRGFMTYPFSPLADFGSSPRAAQTLQEVVSGHATLITADSLRSLFWALRAAHRMNASWLMSSDTASAVDRLKTGDGQYIWRNSSESGQPDTLLGKSVFIDENMAAVGAGARPVAFGDFRRGYTIIERPGAKFLRDPFSDKPSVQLYWYRRVGGAVSDFDAIKALVIST